MSTDRSELLVALKAATPGPWEEAPGGIYGAVVNPNLETECGCNHDDGKTCTEAYGGRLIAESMSKADRQLVVFMHRFISDETTAPSDVKPAPHSLNAAGKCLFCQKYDPAEGGRCHVRSELQQWGFNV